VSSASSTGQWRKESVTIIESQEPMDEDNEVIIIFKFIYLCTETKKNFISKRLPNGKFSKNPS
jgi:hypothetical protein